MVCRRKNIAPPVWNQSNRSRLLLAGGHCVYMLEIAGCAQNLAFGAVVSGEHPEAVLPLIVDNIVNVTDCAAWKRLGNFPCCSFVVWRVAVDFVPLGIVEIFVSV